MTLGRTIGWWLLGASLLVACSDDDVPEPVGIMWGSGASGAFVGDTISLVVFYRDAMGNPIGRPRPTLTWTSSRPSVVAIVSESLAVALDTGRAVLTAMTSIGTLYALPVPFEVLEPWHGRLVWARGLTILGPDPTMAVRDLPDRTIRQLEFGYPGRGHGDPYLDSDGSRLAAVGTRTVAPGAPATVFVVDLGTGVVTAPFDPLPGTQFAPVWMRGDTLLAFLMGTATGWEVFSARPDGSGLQQRTQLRQSLPPFFDVTPENNLLLSLRVGATADLFEVSLTGDTVRRLTQTPEVEENVPAVSPDGSKVAFDTDRHVWIVDRDGSNPRRLLPPLRFPNSPTTTLPASSYNPSWTPDGRFVLVGWSIDETFDRVHLEIYAVRVADGLAIRLSRSPPADAQPFLR